MQQELGAVSETDPATSLASAPVVTIAGQVDISRQLLDRSNPRMSDVALAAELGNAVAERLDLQVVNGSGTNEMRGLLNATGISSVTWTDATPTVAELLPKLGNLYSNIASNFPPDAILLHPRRNAWLLAASDSSGAQINPELPAPAFEVASIPTTLGGDQDAIIMLRRSETILLRSPVTLRAMPEVLSGNLAVRIQAVQYAALLIRQPGSIGKLVGSGLSAPTWS